MLHPVPDWLAISPMTLTRLHEFVALVEKWNPAINLVSKASMSNLWDRHILDSAQLYSLAPKSCRRWVDVGSGAGFPGLVVAILAAEDPTDLKITLVESDQRKATFLAEAVRQLGLDVDLVRGRIERADGLSADVMSARALAPLDMLCDLAHRHMSPGSIALFPKGISAVQEIEMAQKNWNFSLTRHTSKTDVSATVLELKDISHV